MAKLKQFFVYALLAALAITTGFMLRSQLIGGGSQSLSDERGKQGAKALFATTLPDIQGVEQSVSQWQSKVIVVNFWATWCTPCREEIPEFIEAQKKFGERGLVIVGIAIDQLDKVQMFSKEFGINYPVLVGGMSTWPLLEATGNQRSALPYTIVLNRAGEIVDSYLGRINLKKLESQIVPLLKEQSSNRQS
ncbi:thiol-disulfide isomerase or thioredoxin [Nitrosomonas sp. PY1]|uniref:TlpA family protein disulfide reductase n=1 Tax=Nitrosomonas sp. PY1 TaxID=1803906 RepID=UPI001FC8BC0F|nr:TlpA disulfide reductase family protein [Nitrosomonas sp. PY1]GKS70038.1 thiol-disulfide isomerase or thioredoxin [Nitrosomonas sp. PY1]